MPSDKQVDIPLQPWIDGALHWSRLAAAPTGLAAAASGSAFLGISLVLRSLAEREAGAFALIIALLPTIGLVSSLGFPTVITRRYSAAPKGTYDWPRDLSLTIAIALPPLIGAILLSNFVYPLDGSDLLFLFLAGCLVVTINVASSMLGALGAYAESNFVLRLSNATLILPGLLALFLPAVGRLRTVLWFYLAGIGLVGLIAIVMVGQRYRRGGQRIAVSERAQGIMFLLSSAAQLVPDQVMVAVAGVILEAPQIAAFAALAVLLRPFRLLRGILSKIMMPEMIRRRRRSFGRLAAGLWALGILSAVGAILVVPPLARWFYGGRYLEEPLVVPLLAIAGLAQLTSVLPRSHFMGTAPNRQVNRFILMQAVVLMGALVVGGVLIATQGLLGLALAVLLAEVSAFALSHLYWWGYLRRLRASPA